MPQQLDLFASGPDSGIRVLAHADPWVLEEELIARVEASRPAGSVDPVLVLVPTSLLARHVQRRLAARREAWLGVDVLPYRGLVHRILDSAADRPLRPLSKRVLEVALRAALERRPKNRLTRFARERPGSLRALLGTLNELREAGIPAAAVLREARGAKEKRLAEIYREYETELGRLGADAMTDEAGLVAAAASRAAGYGRRYRRVIAHGAYELVGMHLDLLLEVGRHAGIELLLPADLESPAGRYGEAFFRRQLAAVGARVGPLREDGEVRALLGPRLGTLYDEGAAPEPLAADRVSFRHTQGSTAEIAVALRHALRAVEQGVPPVEIGLIARNLDRYAATLEEVIESNAGDWSPYSTTLASPLRREPAIHDLLVLLRVLAEDFPRGPTVGLLGSPRVRWRTLLDEEPPWGDFAERWSRRAGLLGGLSEWTEELPAEAGRPTGLSEEASDEERRAAEERASARRAHAERVGRFLQALAGRAAAADATWDEHADAVAALSRDVIPPAGVAADALAGLLDEMRDLGRVEGGAPAVPFGDMLAWLERAVGETRVPLADEDGGGVRVLDAMQARGLTFERVFFIGVQSDLFPRVPRPDPFASDDFRRRLRERSARPLPVKSEGEDEERLLLALILGAARERLDVSWQRADDTGRAASPSLALREIARAVHGDPDLERLRAGAERISSHPARRLDELAASPGLISAAEESLLLALRAPNPGSAMSALLEREPDLAHSLKMIRATEEFAPRDATYDGRVGDLAAAGGRMSVTALQQLGRCPLQFFFAKVLRVRELEEVQSVYDIPLNEMGDRVHAVLERIYGALADEGLFAGGDARALIGRARELLDPAWAEELRDLEGRRRRRLGLLWSLNSEIWKEAVAAFLERDLRRIADGGFTAIELEKRVTRSLDFGERVEAEVTARFDRVLSDGEQRLIGDYKTSGSLFNQVNQTKLLKANYLQVPLYHLIAEERARVELLGVGPLFDADDPADTVFGFDGFDAKRDRRGGFLETMRTLLTLARAGRYPLNPGSSCRWCRFSLACRRNHPPTVEREQYAEDSADLRDVQHKRDTKPFLWHVRADRGEADASLADQLERSVERGGREPGRPS
jgi:ATP-dependent helicase/nuclease subunit B